MSKSERLREEATKPEVLRSISKRMMTVPGLGFVGEIERRCAPKVG